MVNYKEAAFQFQASLDGTLVLEKFAEVEPSDPEDASLAAKTFAVDYNVCRVNNVVPIGQAPVVVGAEVALDQDDSFQICVTNIHSPEASITGIQSLVCEVEATPPARVQDSPPPFHGRPSIMKISKMMSSSKPTAMQRDATSLCSLRVTSFRQTAVQK